MGGATVMMSEFVIGIFHGELAEFVVCAALGWSWAN